MFRKSLARLLRQASFAPATVRGRQWSSGALLNSGDLRAMTRQHAEPIIRSLAGGSYLGDDTAVCRVLGQYKMLIDTQDMSVGVHLLMEGFWEYWLTEVVLDLVKPGMCAVDLGANLGYFTVLMSDLVGAGGSVHAFEPNPPIAARLERSLQINGFADRATLHRLALDDKDGEATLFVPTGAAGGAHFTRQAGIPGSVVVRTKRFDAIEALHDADFVKIDVEGAEEGVWRGMRGVLDRGRPMTVVLEFNTMRYQDPAAFVATIVADGFSFSVVDPRHGVVPLTPAEFLAGPGEEERLALLRR